MLNFENDSAFTPEQREQVYNTLDAMLKNKNKVFPELLDRLVQSDLMEEWVILDHKDQ
jgi:hypothetical protein